jgi:hypothetical protein
MLSLPPGEHHDGWNLQDHQFPTLIIMPIAGMADVAGIAVVKDQVQRTAECHSIGIKLRNFGTVQKI